MRHATAAALAFSLLSMTSLAAEAKSLRLETTKGDIVIHLRDDIAPRHAERLATLAAEGFYNNVPFHRVIPGFMAQTGDPTGTGSGGSNYPDLRAEFSSERYERGVVGMARTDYEHSANSQFFIMFGPAPGLDGKYTIVGRVTSGMETVDRLNAGTDGNNGAVADPDRIVRATVID